MRVRRRTRRRTAAAGRYGLLDMAAEVLLWLGLIYSMYRRWRSASPLQQRAMAPAFVAGVVLGVAHYAHITARQLGVEADTVIALSSVWTFCIVAVCAGFLGGLAASAILGALLAPWLTPFGFGEGAMVGAGLAALGFLGDVTVSALKRDLGIKDSGSLLPGHGGALDRLDSLVFAAPVFLHYVRYFYGA